MNRNGHGEANEPDTYKRPIPMGNVSSRIYRHFSSIAIIYGNRNDSHQEARRSPNKKSSNEYEQAPKTIRTLNIISSQLRDSTASNSK